MANSNVLDLVYGENGTQDDGGTDTTEDYKNVQVNTANTRHAATMQGPCGIL